ncbi:cytochrome P450 315a1, mitochondrial [Neocloeon triangulifer]|uniref:cytochrome P450 315a1, mitochondrial n=1 Tax=Neocloeon triangulifer TaxID=2078957 RepID=UPI00286EF815|nr:cytochrome P450 315a1, mitochondrial [Neocloeon triangulifer]
MLSKVLAMSCPRGGCTAPGQRILPRRMQATVSHTAAIREASEREEVVREAPSPRGLPLVGTTLSLWLRGSAAQLHRYVDLRHAQLGPVYREAIGPVDAYFVADPLEMRRVFQLEGKHPRNLLPDAWILYNQLYGCKRGLLFMDGEEWLHFRRIMNSIMLKDADTGMEQPCRQVAADLVAEWSQHAHQQVPRLEQALYQWSTEVLVANLVGGDKFAEHSSAIRRLPGLRGLSEQVRQVFCESSKLSLLPARVARAIRLPAWARFERAVDHAVHGASSLVLDLLPFSRGGDGMLERMLAAGVELSDTVRIVADLILAAGDTSAVTMQWVLYLLAKNPDAQERAAQDPQILRGVVKEAMRLYPVAPFLTRILPDESRLAGYTIPGGSLVLLSLYTSGRSAANFPDPSRFWPERWSRENSSGGLLGVNHASASIPFGLGARSCIGRKLADIQLTQLISQLLAGFRIELVEPEKEVDMVLRLVSVPNHPLKLKLVPRK